MSIESVRKFYCLFNWPGEWAVWLEFFFFFLKKIYYRVSAHALAVITDYTCVLVSVRVHDEGGEAKTLTKREPSFND